MMCCRLFSTSSPQYPSGSTDRYEFLDSPLVSISALNEHLVKLKAVKESQQKAVVFIVAALTLLALLSKG